jgi:cytochrome P450
VHGSLLRYVFSLPKSAAQTYYNDDSGEHEKPHEDSSVESHNRVDFLTRSSFVKFLTGPGLAPLSARFEHNISEGLNCLAPSQSWIPITDLMDVFQHHVSGAVIDAMCGHFLLKQHPTFLSDFWKIDHNIMTLFTRTPQFMARNAYRSRDRALDAVKAWHAWAKDNFDPAAIGPDGDDPYWGTKFFRERQDMFLNMTGFNADAVASQELAFIWGANTNAIISAFWVTLEVFKDPEILATIRDEVEDCIKPDVTGQVAFDLPKLLKKPFLQAVLSETLRLRVNGFLVRRPMRESLKIHEWTIPKDRFCLTSSTPGHMDPNVWCQGANAAHAVTDFWPGRFLKPNKSTGQMEFSLKGTEGSWMPFGGGIHMCPGKVFAKHVICLSVATMVTRYDCIVTAKVKDMEMSTRNFGFGTSAPVGKVPVLMRRRDAR